MSISDFEILRRIGKFYLHLYEFIIRRGSVQLGLLGAQVPRQLDLRAQEG